MQLVNLIYLFTSLQVIRLPLLYGATHIYAGYEKREVRQERSVVVLFMLIKRNQPNYFWILQYKLWYQSLPLSYNIFVNHVGQTAEDKCEVEQDDNRAINRHAVPVVPLLEKPFLIHRNLNVDQDHCDNLKTPVDHASILDLDDDHEGQEYQT